MLVQNHQEYLAQSTLLTNKNVITLANEEKINQTPEVNTQVAELSEIRDDNQEQKDAQRQAFVGYIGHQSRQTQAEIYLSVALEEKVSLDNGAKEMYASLKEVQQQNNAVKAYAAYMESPQPEPRLSA